MSALREIPVAFGVEFDDAGLKKGEGAVHGFLGKLKDVGEAVAEAFVVEKVREWVHEVADEADALAKTATALGVSAQELQGWQHAAELSGVATEVLNVSLGRLAKFAADASDGGATQAAAFKKLGVNIKDANGQLRPVSDLFEDAGAAIGAMKNPTQVAGVASEIFGRQWAKLIPLFKEGKDGMRALRNEVKDLGFEFDDDFLEVAQEANDNSERFEKSLKGLKIQLASAVLPAISKLAIGAAHLVASFGRVLKSTNAVKAGFLFLGVLGLAKVSALLGPLGGINSLLKLGGRLLLKWVIPFLLLEDAFTFLEGGESAIGALLDKVFGAGTQEKVRAFINSVIKSVEDFIDDIRNKPGKVVEDWKLFWSTLASDAQNIFGSFFAGWLTSLVDFWNFVINALTGGWDNFLAATNAAWEGIKLALAIVWTELKFGFLEVVAQVEDAFGGLWNSILSGAQNALGLIQKVVGAIPGAGEIAGKINSAVEGIGGAKVAVDAVQQVEASRTQARLGLAAKGDEIAAQSAALKGVINNPPANVNTTVNVTVPPGTPNQVANDVGKAAAKGANKGVSNPRATKAGLVQQAG